MSRTISDIFAKNRAEELPDDVWKMFVHPRNDGKFDLKKWTKSTVVEGGRGSGKTMFIKYHCHPTIFSKEKKIITKDDFEFIGFHWRPDTFFTQNIKEQFLGTQWESSFVSFMAISVLIEFSKLLNNICNSNYNNDEFKIKLKQFNIPKPICDSLSLPTQPLIDSLEDFEDKQYFLTHWINSNQDSQPAPFTLDLINSFDMIISRLSRQFEEFETSVFNIFVDEFENLTEEQQKIVNTWVKHSKRNAIVSIAHKKHANVTRKTKSQESIVARNDFRIVDIDAGYQEDFENLAAEVFVLKWSHDNKLEGLELLLEFCSDPNHINDRKDSVYLSKMKKLVKEILPGMTLREISDEIFTDQVLFKKLKSVISQGLKENDSNLSPSHFIDSEFKQASIINAALLNRKSNQSSPDSVLIEFDKLKNNKTSKYKNWIQNNLKGVILYLYNTTSNKICPVYSGFDQYVLMSKGNLRHFLELCHQSFARLEDKGAVYDYEKPIPISVQTEATKFTSKLELDKISDLGCDGKFLKRIARRLGKLFAYSQSRKSQSEPEVNHFSIPMSDKSSLKPEVNKLINECLMWSVLYEEEGTKNKSVTSIEEYDYVLHPVLSAHFGISSSKKRKLSLSIEDIETLFIGDDNDFANVLLKYESKWSLDKKNKEDQETWEQLSLV
ncbi:ORC-CDC6 family AAA ATPase [Photobacterium damselae]|uniref:ORC-CDC6 family AAA ATPase n=1 Tax=Photobacterium damselae TaxID=38293 RepID=UPI0040676D65